MQSGETDMPVKPVPNDCHAITPYLTVQDAGRLIEFLKNAFNGVERARFVRPDGTILHAQVRIADSLLMVGEPQGPWKPMPTMLYFYVADIDATYQRAVEAGAVSVVAPTNMFYGDRHACVKDPAGNYWWIATRIEDLSAAEMQERTTAFYKQRV
jgi:PhnB protein